MQLVTNKLAQAFLKGCFYTLITAILILSSHLAMAKDITDQKEQLTKQHTKSSGGLIDKSNHGSEENPKSPRRSIASRGQQHSAQTTWLYDAEFSYLIDNDGDGYHHRFRVTFDADTDLISHRIYAKLYLVSDTTDQLYYVTDDFTIFGEAYSDNYEVTTSLTDGYDSDVYDIRIAIFDANSHVLLDTIDADDDEDLYGRYLEQVEDDTMHAAIFTIQELTVVLSGDYDEDGYFPELEITVDPDISFGSAWVDISIYIVDRFNNEELLHHSDNLYISDYHTSDKSTAYITLDTGYNADQYHLRAELRDAESGMLLATNDTTRSAGLSIESKDYDDYYDHYNGYDDYHAKSEGHGGTLGWFGILGLIGLASLRKK